MKSVTALQAIIGGIVERPHTFHWSVQGFGMLRTYFGSDKRWRLNIWHSRLAVPLCSTIHDHPWSFESLIVAGQFENRRYFVEPASELFATHHWQVIQTGPGGGPDGEKGFCKLTEMTPEFYIAGDTYSQGHEEVHASIYQDGCITLNDRRRLEDGEHAKVFYPIGGTWVDAMPREATAKEINIACEAARKRLEELRYAD